MSGFGEYLGLTGDSRENVKRRQGTVMEEVKLDTETRKKYIDFIANRSKPEVRDGMRATMEEIDDFQLTTIFKLYWKKSEEIIEKYLNQ